MLDAKKDKSLQMRSILVSILKRYLIIFLGRYLAGANAFYLGGTNEVSSKNYLCRLAFKLFLLE